MFPLRCLFLVPLRSRPVLFLSQLQKRKQIAESLREMNRENVAKLAVREKQKLVEAEEDKRLMKEYRERLDRREWDFSALGFFDLE